jgi:dTDP-4-dehydrorhamnose reductase
MKIFLTGVTGTLGSALARILEPEHRLSAPDEVELDLLGAEKIEDTLHDVRPEFIVHCAAMTNVDTCETDPLTAERVNHFATRVLSACARDLQIPMIYVSTDYVFDGEKGDYVEHDRTNPIQVYGETKLRGEMAVMETLLEHYIVRTSWIFGPGGTGFLSNLVEHAKKGPLQLVTDQTTCPTYAPDLAEALKAFVDKTPPFGIYHAAGARGTTPYDFGKRTLELGGVDQTVEPIESSSLVRPAKRPGNTVLHCGKLEQTLGISLPDWEDALRRFLLGR